MYLHKFDHFDKFRAYLVYYRKKNFLKNSKKKFLSEWAEFLCVPKGHMWDSLCEIIANFVNPPCLGEVLKFQKRAFFKCVQVKQF